MTSLNRFRNLAALQSAERKVRKSTAIYVPPGSRGSGNVDAYLTPQEVLAVASDSNRGNMPMGWSIDEDTVALARNESSAGRSNARWVTVKNVRVTNVSHGKNRNQ